MRFFIAIVALTCGLVGYFWWTSPVDVSDIVSPENTPNASYEPSSQTIEIKHVPLDAPYETQRKRLSSDGFVAARELSEESGVLNIGEANLDVDIMGSSSNERSVLDVGEPLDADMDALKVEANGVVDVGPSLNAEDYQTTSSTREPLNIGAAINPSDTHVVTNGEVEDVGDPGLYFDEP